MNRHRFRALAAAGCLAALPLTALPTGPAAHAGAAWAAFSAAGVSGASPARVATRGQGSASTPVVRAVITSLSPLNARPGRTLIIHGTLTDTTGGAVTGLGVSLQIGAPVSNRTDLARQELQPVQEGAVVEAATVHAPATLAAHRSAGFSVTVPLDRIPELNRGRVNVYPLQIRVAGLGPGQSFATLLGEASTFLPWLAYAPTSRLHVTTLWPIDAPPQQAASGALTSAGLTRSISTGRLARLVGAATADPHAAPVTWLVEPSLLQAIATLEAPWSLAGAAHTQPRDPQAATFLSALARTGTGELVSLPYGDPDVVALQRAGLTTDLTTAFPLAVDTVQGVLHRLPSATVSWPQGGVVDQATLDALAGADVSTVLLSDSQIPTAPTAASPTASATAELSTIGPPVRALALDGALSRLLAQPLTASLSPAMAVQQVLAETALIVAEQPNGPVRDVVLAPPRYWNPDPAYARDLLAALGRASWLTPVTLSATAQDPVGARLGLQPYPASARAAELPPVDLSAAAPAAAHPVAQLRAELASLTRMLHDSKPLAGLQAALYRAESTAWRPPPGGNPGGGNALRAGVAAAIAGLESQVRVASAPAVTLASRNGNLPFTIANDLPYQVSVRLTVNSPDPSKLRTPVARSETVGPREKLRVTVPVQTQRSGTFPIFLQLSMPDGRPLGPPVQVVLRSSAYGGLALAITVGALAVLVGALLIRLVRRLRRRASGSDPEPVPASSTTTS